MTRYRTFADLVSAGLVTNRQTLSRWIKEGRFPAPVKLGPRRVAWRDDDLQAHEARLVAQREGKAA